jgi:hypothetical protein
MTKRGVIGIAVTTLAMWAAPSLAADTWVVRICRGATEASAIKISVGKPGADGQTLVNWQSDAKETDFPVADTMMPTGDQLRVVADSEPADGKVAMCVLSGATAVKAMNFTDKMDVNASKSAAADAACKCAKGQ